MTITLSWSSWEIYVVIGLVWVGYSHINTKLNAIARATGAFLED